LCLFLEITPFSSLRLRLSGGQLCRNSLILAEKISVRL